MHFRPTTIFQNLSGILFILALVFFAAQPANAQLSITVTGAWYETVDKNDLVFGAGSDLENIFTSVSGQVSIDISGAINPDHSWRVDVRRIDTNWDNRFRIYIMRTTSGSGSGVAGGEIYQEVTPLDNSFFTGVGNVTDIKVQLRVTGTSVQIKPDSYSTVLYYTIFDNP